MRLIKMTLSMKCTFQKRNNGVETPLIGNKRADNLLGPFLH
jgi:hypothetical protein